MSGGAEGKTTRIPADAQVDEIPEPFLPFQGARKRVWEDLWQQPVATLWDRSDLASLTRMVVLQTTTEVYTDSRLLAELKQLEDRFLLNPTARARHGVEVLAPTSKQEPEEAEDQRECLACGKKITGTRRRKYCDNGDVCKRRYQRGARAKAESDNQSDDSAPTGSTFGSIEAATMFELQEAKRLGTVLGQAALAMARRMDSSHTDTGAGMASLARQLQATLEAATANMEVADDPVDEVRAARERKLRAAQTG